MIKLLTEMLSIPSPTFHEQQLTAFIKDFANKHFPDPKIREFEDCLIIELGQDNLTLPHIALVGHSDVVPQWFEPHRKGDQLFGAGASDMLAAVAAYLQVIADGHKQILERARISIVIYAREEGTPLEENGLHDLIEEYGDFFENIDLAVIGEPTDNTIQVGCCGSLHLSVVSTGVACHSARPWNGENAFYKALPFISAMAKLEPVKHEVFGCDFFDVLSVTEESSTPGRTSVPGRWEANVNFRYAPVRSAAEAEAEAVGFINDLGVDDLVVTLKDNSPAGSVNATPLLTRACELIGAPVEAKQAWTDVAQLSALGVACFNYGPGLTSQAHKDNEHCLVSLLEDYGQKLNQLLVSI